MALMCANLSFPSLNELPGDTRPNQVNLPYIAVLCGFDIFPFIAVTLYSSFHGNSKHFHNALDNIGFLYSTEMSQ